MFPEFEWFRVEGVSFQTQTRLSFGWMMHCRALWYCLRLPNCGAHIHALIYLQTLAAHNLAQQAHMVEDCKR